MFKILIISVITFMIVIIIFLIFMSFLNVDIKTNSKTIEKFDVQEPTFSGGAFINNVSDSTTEVYIQFNSSGNLIIPTTISCDILIVGGGGGGGSRHAGGGGAGAVIYLKNQTLINGTYTITIGNGGNGGYNGPGTNGGDSIISLNNNNIYLAKGGGFGAYSIDGGNGGSGGGVSYGHAIGSAVNTNIPSGTYGNNGGSGTYGNTENGWGGGGGGGASSAGSNAVLNGIISTAGNGGNGIQISIKGTNIYYGGGGGGGVSWNGNSAGSGGLGGGGAGSKGTATATSGIANTGGGGGGAGFQGGANGKAGNGGSGVVIIRYIGSINQNSISELFSKKKPWGMYFADDYDGTYLKDYTGNERHAYTSGNINKSKGSGNGASGNISFISGGTRSIVSWPDGSIPSQFTILTLTRWTGGSRQRIISSSIGNWLHGHWYQRRGVCYYEGWKKYEPSIGNLDDWLCCIGKNGGTTPNNILIDGIPYGQAGGGNGGYKLGINNNPWANPGNGTGEVSDWALSCVIIWDKHLNDYEMQILNILINKYKNTGIPLIDIINNNTNSDFTSDNNNNETKLITIDEKFNSNNQAFIYIPLYNSILSFNNDIKEIKKNGIEYIKSSGDILTIFDNNRYRDGSFNQVDNINGEKITLKFKTSFVLKRILFVANERKNAPASWTINIGSNTLSGTATPEDYDEIQGKSKDFCIKFYIDNQIYSDTYEIIFTKILGGTQLNFNRIVLYEGITPKVVSTATKSIEI